VCSLSKALSNIPVDMEAGRGESKSKMREMRDHDLTMTLP